MHTEGPKNAPLINIGCGDDARIADLARLVAESVVYPAS